ncbi:MAG: helix-turn-helix domain-containing protein [Thermodesulfovibrionales bacterium]|nr:helix-turn-helix domain-containing protein [Thermodesulfovibrionales bacterium]
MVASLRRFSGKEVAQQRLKIIKFYEKRGEDATKEAFGVDRKLISKWRKRLKENGGRLEELIPYSTRPKRTRKSEIPREIIDFIRRLREKYPRLGKEKIKPLLDEYCKDKGLKTISEATVGNIIRRHNFFFQKSGRVYHNPDSKSAKKSRHRQKRTKVKHPPRPKEFRYIISDTVERITDGIKDYFYSAIDATGKFALTLNYKRQNSKNMRDFYERFKSVYTCEIKVWQSDKAQRICENLIRH